jgi:hypothetical protein
MSTANAARAILFSLAVMNATYALSADCGARSTVAAATNVYDREPVFSSRTGWTLGDPIAKLNAGDTVFVCAENSVGIFFNKQTWYRINFNGHEFGWIPADFINVSDQRPDARQPNRSLLSGLLVGPAYAQEAPARADDNAAPPPPGFSLKLLMLISFVFIILGIFAKVTFDEIEKNKSFGWRQVIDLRKCVKGIVVSPMVFITFLAAGNFAFANEVAVVIFFCLAFQNGFFWQTVIPSSKEATRSRVPEPA